ncbi:MAG TPA: hypothetical protein PLU95_05025 [Syntrophales bacterium]|nr:hypothetical protein [Syntrophales bacterium]HPN08644.1 hypothetical protein [Syntrophales bacterium]HPX81701.1 hypothetical protein [Syntrophales bacterium]HQB14555.1 hypothetical protein [Syntrophales bacterium]HQK78325.1 hypothetical protein [Syntrophales bacterium]
MAVLDEKPGGIFGFFDMVFIRAVLHEPPVHKPGPAKQEKILQYGGKIFMVTDRFNFSASIRRRWFYPNAHPEGSAGFQLRSRQNAAVIYLNA